MQLPALAMQQPALRMKPATLALRRVKLVIEGLDNLLQRARWGSPLS